MTATEIATIIRQVFGLGYISKYSPGRLILLDDVYDPVTEKDVQRKWYEVWIKSSYKKDAFDCEDMAFQEMLRIRSKGKAGKSKAFGVAGGVFANLPKQELHAVNFLVKPDSSIVLWDYQLESFYEPSKEDRVWWAVI